MLRFIISPIKLFSLLETHHSHQEEKASVYANMFSIYITLTKGQRLAFKKFLSGGDDKIIMANTFLKVFSCLSLL